MPLAIAQPGLAQRSKRATRPSGAECGPLNGQVLRCPELGFNYTVPFGWVDRTSDMQQDAEAESSVEAGSAASPRPEKPRTLLAAFERPPGAPGETVNSAVVIAAESLKDYHGIKTAADYFGPVTELAEHRGFKGESGPYEFTSGARRMVRADYSKQRGKLEMWQSTLVVIEKGEIVSFTFVGGRQDELDELVGNLKFAAGATPKK